MSVLTKRRNVDNQFLNWINETAQLTKWEVDKTTIQPLVCDACVIQEWIQVIQSDIHVWGTVHRSAMQLTVYISYMYIKLTA